MKGKPWGMWLLILATVILSVFIYVLLVAELVWFPDMAGHTFTVDWPKIAVALVPGVFFLLLLLITRSSSVRAKLPGVQLEFATGIPRSEDSTVMLDGQSVMKGRSRDLPFEIERTRRGEHAPRILMVRMAHENRRPGVDFFALREYVFEFRKVAPIQYIVFLDENLRYLAYMDTDRFVRRYPKLQLESLLVEYEQLDDDLRPLLLPKLGEFEDTDTLRQRISEFVTRLYWRRPLGIVDQSDLGELGAIRDYLTSKDPQQAYAWMLANQQSGCPVIDNRRTFLGMATKASIEAHAVAKLISDGSSRFATSETSSDRI